MSRNREVDWKWAIPARPVNMQANDSFSRTLHEKELISLKKLSIVFPAADKCLTKPSCNSMFVL